MKAPNTFLMRRKVDRQECFADRPQPIRHSEPCSANDRGGDAAKCQDTQSRHHTRATLNLLKIMEIVLAAEISIRKQSGNLDPHG